MNDSKKTNKAHLLADFKQITSNFNSLADAKYKQSMNTKLLILFCSVVIAIVMVMSYRLQSTAMDKILVVDNAGEMRKVKAMDEDKLYISLLFSHCEQTGVYANSFDKLSLEENQLKASYLCNKADLDRIFATYQSQQAYADATNRGVCYKYAFKNILTAKNRGGNEYSVSFYGILSIIDGSNTKYVKIISTGIASRVTPKWPDNPNGYNFRTYRQTYEEVANEDIEEADSLAM